MKTKLTSIICSFASLVRLTLAAVALLAAPAASRADTIYVSDTGHNTIKKFTSGGIGSVFANTGLNEPFGLAFDSAGNLYAANGYNNTIEKFTPGGVGSVFANTGLLNPTALAFDSTGNLYAANWLNNTIEKFTLGGVGSVFANTGLSSPWGLAFDSAGNLYAANGGNNTIEKFTLGGVGSVFANTGLSAPFGLAFDSAGNLYVANQGNNTIEKFTSGGVGSVFANTGLDVPSGLAFDSAGNLYAVNQGNNTVEKFTPGGVGSVFANSGGLFGPTYIAIQPGLVVPEPSTWAMLGLGIPALLALRRKRERVSMRDRGHTSSNKQDAANPAIASLFQPCSPAAVVELTLDGANTMEKIMRTNFFLVYVCGGFVLAAVCTARADTVLWYNGDLPSGGGGTVNEQTGNVGVSFIYDNFTVTDPAGWIVDRLWSNDAMQLTGISQASWYIRSDMSVGNGGAVVSSGIGFATQTPTGRVNPAIGFTEYSIQISGLNIYLSPGIYWLSVAPLVGSESGGMLKSYVSATSGANAVGTPPGNDANSLFYSPWLGYNYSSAFQTDYSMGIAGSVVPEPSCALLIAGGVSVFVIRRRRA